MNWRGETNGMGRVTVKVLLTSHEDILMARRGVIAPEKVRRVEIDGVVDTGATHVVIPERVANELGLPIKGEMEVRYADHRSARRAVVEDLSLEVLGREGVFRAIVEPARETVLIGAIVLEDLDLLVDCTHKTLHPRDPAGMVAEIE